VVVGGMSTQKQERLLAQKPEIIVATPGRYWELLEEVKNLSIEKKSEIDLIFELIEE
jgi:superfamily II DNA/RNA helicase